MVWADECVWVGEGGLYLTSLLTFCFPSLIVSLSRACFSFSNFSFSFLIPSSSFLCSSCCFHNLNDSSSDIRVFKFVGELDSLVLEELILFSKVLKIFTKFVESVSQNWSPGK